MSLYRVHGPSAFGGRAELGGDASHTFPHGVLAAITPVGGKMGQLELESGVRQILALFSGHHSPGGGEVGRV